MKSIDVRISWKCKEALTIEQIESALSTEYIETFHVRELPSQPEQGQPRKYTVEEIAKYLNRNFTGNAAHLYDESYGLALKYLMDKDDGINAVLPQPEQGQLKRHFHCEGCIDDGDADCGRTCFIWDESKKAWWRSHWQPIPAKVDDNQKSNLCSSCASPECDKDKCNVNVMGLDAVDKTCPDCELLRNELARLYMLVRYEDAMRIEKVLEETKQKGKINERNN